MLVTRCVACRACFACRARAALCVRLCTTFALAGAVAASLALPARAQLQVADLFLKFTPPQLSPAGHGLKFTWSNFGSTVTVTGLSRSPGGVTPVGPPDPPNTVFDYAWTSGTRYEYKLVGTQVVPQENPTTHQITYVTIPWQSNLVNVTPCDIAATATGTADSRIDKRYGDIHYQDYAFNTNPKPNNKPGVYLYRGGLYAGHNGDGSEVGRSYLKFPLVPPVFVNNVPENLYPFGGVWAFSPRFARTGYVSVACQRGNSSAWDAATLVWTNAPAPVGSAAPAQYLSWDSANPVSAWYTLNALPLVKDQTMPGAGGNTLTALLMSGSETPGAGWAYFAANAYQHPVSKPDNTTEMTSGYGPRLLYAWGAVDSGNNGGGGGGGGGGLGTGDDEPVGGGGIAPGSTTPSTTPNTPQAAPGTKP